MSIYFRDGTIGKTTITTGPPEKTDDSQYHGDYSIGRYLWLSSDGTRIFTASGNIFRASSDIHNDMIYTGKLTGINNLVSIADSVSTGKIIALDSKVSAMNRPDPLDCQIIFYDDMLQKSESIYLPSYKVDNRSFSYSGKFVFINQDSTRYYVIVEANGYSVPDYKYGIIGYDLVKLPKSSR